MRLLLVALLAGSCFALTELEQNVVDAINEAKVAVAKTNSKITTVAENSDNLQTQKANGDSKAEQDRGDILAEATKIMVEKYGPEILEQLNGIDIDALYSQDSTRSRRYANNNPAPNSTAGCPPDDTNCNSQKNNDYRSISGVCNNRGNKNLGKAVTPIRRLLGNASYADGIGAVRSKSVLGSPLPSTRDISNRLHAEGVTPVFDFMTNHLHMQFGQFIAHDTIFMPSSVGPNGETLDCSSCNSSSVTPNCAPIAVPAGDSYFPANTCIRLTRALNGQKGLGQRLQIDQNTHFIDLSPVYGSEICEAAKVRSFRNGELLEYQNGQYTLPPQNKNDSNCQSTNPNFCFLAGDFRNSLHPGLIPLHTAYIKLHNFIAQSMRKIRTDWDDETTYQEARRMNIALHQFHVYNEYLPKLLGQKTMTEFGLTPLTQGFFNGYDPNTDPSVPAEFTTAAFRFGHSQVRKDIPRVTNSNQTAGAAVDLGSNIFYTESLYQNTAGGTESMLDGMVQQPAMSVDRQFSFPIRNQLFEIRGKKASGVDLVAVNIMRGRDAGLFPYNTYRVAAGLTKLSSFDDLGSEMEQANAAALKAVYAHVDDIDLYSGMLMEKPANGALLGRTATYILGNTFRNLKNGDRFFYETQTQNSRSLTPDELALVRKLPLSKIFCMVTTQMTLVNKNIFDLNSQRVPCSSLPDLDVTPFTQSPPAGQNPPDHCDNNGGGRH